MQVCTERLQSLVHAPLTGLILICRPFMKDAIAKILKSVNARAIVTKMKTARDMSMRLSAMRVKSQLPQTVQGVATSIIVEMLDHCYLTIR